MDCQETLNEIPAVSESVQKVLCQLHDGKKPMTGKELREATGMPRRTIYTALGRLRDMGVLHEQINLRDARQTYFWLDERRLHKMQG